MIANQNSEIHNLMNIIRDLNASIVLLTEAITLLQSSVNIATQSSIPEQTTSNTSTSLKTPSEASINFSANIPPKPPPAVSERRSNVVFYESPPKTSKFDRQKHELGIVVNTLSGIESSITFASIKDIY